MSKRKTLKLHEWQEFARMQSVREALADDILDKNAEFALGSPIYLNKPAREALQPYLDDSRETPDAS